MTEKAESKVLTLTGILNFLCKSQKHLDENVFENRHFFEIKDDYDYNKEKNDNLFNFSKPTVTTTKQTSTSVVHKTKLFDINSIKNMANNYLKNNVQDEEKEEDVEEEVVQNRNIKLNVVEERIKLKKRVEKVQDNIFLSDSFHDIFGEDFRNYMYIDLMVRSQNRGRNHVYTFMTSVFAILDGLFLLKGKEEKERIIKQLFKKIHMELFLNGLYQKYLYNKYRKFNKEDLHKVLNSVLLFRVEFEDIHIIHQIVADYLGLNIFIFQISDVNKIDFDNSKSYLTKQYEGIENPYIPNIMLIRYNDFYYPIIHCNDSDQSVLKYSVHREYIDNIWRLMNLNIKDNFEKKLKNDEIKESNEELAKEIEKLNKMKMEELVTKAESLNISIYKKSDKTDKNIKKKKQELLDDIIHYLEHNPNEGSTSSVTTTN